MNTDQVIQLEKVNKWYDDFHVLKDIDLTVNKGQKFVICGPSGQENHDDKMHQSIGSSSTR